ncbi:MFS transporter [Streptomyces resistomycificus]|uniref:MFS transporter n=1 Tax=Streptomyces resistomycificus TaxID=67356 RepID=UPI000A92054A|nr:MFS transporter [Streptomyces resistomycificus]
MSSTPTASMAKRGRTLALVVILLAMFIDLIGVTILNVILPSIQTGLDASPAALQWMQAGYTLALALGIVCGARLGDMLGHKRVFVVGMLGFAAASALCALSVGPEMLVGARVVQGAFAAAVIPQVLSQIQVMYSAEERGGPMAAYASLSGLAATLGPIVGPALLEWDLAGASWRMAFWVNVPLSLLVALTSVKLLPDSRTADAVRIDVTGVVISTVGLLLVLYPLIEAADPSRRTVWSYLSIAAGVVVLGGFAAYERRVSARGGSPLLEMSLFKFRSVQGGLLVQLLFFVPAMGFFLVFMLFLQHGIGMSPMDSGLMMLPWSIAVPVFATVSAAVLLPRIGRLTVQIGLVVMAVGFALIAFAAAGATQDTGWTDLFWGVLVGGAGMGMLVAPLMQLTLSDMPVESAGSGSALYNTITQLAASVGVAVVGTVFFTSIEDVAHTPAAVAEGYGDALATSLWLGVGLLAVAFVSSFLLPRGPVATTEEPAGEVVSA